jgi:hypothetical protein
MVIRVLARIKFMRPKKHVATTNIFNVNMTHQKIFKFAEINGSGFWELPIRRNLGPPKLRGLQ